MIFTYALYQQMPIACINYNFIFQNDFGSCCSQSFSLSIGSYSFKMSKRPALFGLLTFMAYTHNVNCNYRSFSVNNVDVCRGRKKSIGNASKNYYLQNYSTDTNLRVILTILSDHLYSCL